MQVNDRIFVAGHRGLVGSALVRKLHELGFKDVVTRTHAELDLADEGAVQAFFQDVRPQFVFLAAAKVGGILANQSYPADFIRENLAIQNNVIEGSHQAGVQRLLFLGSSCIYPKFAPQPIREDALLTGALEPTNRPYALAKIAGVEMCWAYNRQFGTRFVAAMPTNLYGPGDNFDLANSHVLPALIRKAIVAKQNGDASFVVWGSGTPRRELLHSDDLAAACVFLMQSEDAVFDSLIGEDRPPLINIGTGVDLTIRELAELVARVVGFRGEIVFDASKPDGTPRKVLDVSAMRSLGWSASIPLEQGIGEVYELAKEVFASAEAA